MSLVRVGQELEPGWCQSIEMDAQGRHYTVLSAPPGALSCCLMQEESRQFMLETTSVVLYLRLPCPAPARHRIKLVHAGWIRRGDLKWARGHQVLVRLAKRLCASRELQAVIKDVDFTSFELAGEGSSVCVKIRLYGACELRSRWPAMRRYVRMGTQQARALRALTYAVASAAGELT